MSTKHNVLTYEGLQYFYSKLSNNLITSEDVLEYMVSEKIIDPIASNINSLFINNDGKIYTL